MGTGDDLRTQWLQLRERLERRRLLDAPDASLSLRIPGGDAMWFGLSLDAQPLLRRWRGEGGLHARLYGLRDDLGAIAAGGGRFGACLAAFGGAMPEVFDEQARHLGRMGPACDDLRGLARAVRAGGNMLLMQGRPVCLGTTGLRMALNAELFEKCAKAYVLAVAGGGRVRPLPWIVRTVANRRLIKDERRAAERFARGLLPEECKGY